jgi:pentatricopeptide repeat protein
MEAYVLEPTDIPKMEAVFHELANNPRLELQGTHFATLINAYGCVAKDLDKALDTYNSIFEHPRKPVVDALVFEAIANVCVAHRRVDLMPQLVAKMSGVGVHMTAYIVNAMIKGYAAVGDIERSRELFESLVDPAEGVAALHNHAPHEPSGIPSVSPMEPVYREPSTWEAMVRAELGSGSRDCAIALIERLEARKYPEAVVNRIRGILVDHSQLI